jgi:hypothetical protein
VALINWRAERHTARWYDELSVVGLGELDLGQHFVASGARNSFNAKPNRSSIRFLSLEIPPFDLTCLNFPS